MDNSTDEAQQQRVQRANSDAAAANEEANARAERIRLGVLRDSADFYLAGAGFIFGLAAFLSVLASLFFLGVVILAISKDESAWSIMLKSLDMLAAVGCIGVNFFLGGVAKWLRSRAQ